MPSAPLLNAAARTLLKSFCGKPRHQRSHFMLRWQRTLGHTLHRENSGNKQTKKVGRKRSGSLRDASQQQRTSSDLLFPSHFTTLRQLDLRGAGLDSSRVFSSHARDEQRVTQSNCFRKARVCATFPRVEQINRSNADGDVGAKFEEKMLRKDQSCEQPS